MEHELLQNEPDFHLKLTNKTKKEKEKIDPGERKKWNFRKSSTSETAGKRSPSPTSGLINTSSEVRSKRTVSPTMIFENQITDQDYINEQEHCVPSSPIPISSPPPNVQQTHISSKSVSFDTPSNPKRLIQKTQSVSTSPPVIAPPQSTRKPVEKIFRQSSAPASSPIHYSKKIMYQQSPILSSESFTPSSNNIQTDRSVDIPRIRSTSDIPPNNQWKSVQQTLFSQTPEKLHQDGILNRQRLTSEKDTPGGESLDESSNIMWQQGNKQELSHGNWTDFSSISNEVFVPDDKAWGMAENVAIEPDENGQESPREAPKLSNSSNSSESEDEQETEESVWKITEEQKSYYLNQFKFLQPAEKGVVTGQKARDFFLKSGLTTDVLSKIWNLADLDNDGALNFEEFCIAMHVVVAVRHGLEVPTTLPEFLIPEQFEKQASSVASPQKTESSNDQLSLPDVAQTWARFSPDPDNLNKAHLPEEDTKKVQPQVQPQVQPAVQAVQQHHRVERSMSDSTSADEAVSKDIQPTRKISVGIPRTRGAPKQTSLLDQPHWAILPPPSKFTKEATEDTGKTVPIGTIIPDDTPDNDIVGPVLLKVENVDKSSPRDSQSDSSSSDEDDQKERPKSLTNEQSVSTSPSLSKGSSHDSVGVSQDSVDSARKSAAAPVPPPRKKTGHSRSSSLDLQKLFNNKGGSNSFQPNVDKASNKSEKHKSLDEEFLQNNLTNGTDDKETGEPAHENQENFADFSKFDSGTTITHPESFSRHRRSASLDSTHAISWVEPSPPQQNPHDQVKHPGPNQIPASLPRPVPKKKPASPPLPVRQKKDTQQDSGSDGVVEKERKANKEPIHFVVKPLTRLEQLHARIRDLKAKNTILSRVNNELQQEFKEMMERRIKLESSVEQLKPLSNG